MELKGNHIKYEKERFFLAHEKLLFFEAITTNRIIIPFIKQPNTKHSIAFATKLQRIEIKWATLK